MHRGNGMPNFVIDANGSAILFPGKVLVLVLPDNVIQSHKQYNMLRSLPLPIFAGVEQLLPRGQVEIRISSPDTGEAFYVEVAGNCLEWVPR
jgi:hypothetical protein